MWPRRLSALNPPLVSRLHGPAWLPYVRSKNSLANRPRRDRCDVVLMGVVGCTAALCDCNDQRFTTRRTTAAIIETPQANSAFHPFGVDK